MKMKVKANFSSFIHVLLIALLLLGMTPGMVYAADESDTGTGEDSTLLPDLIIESIACDPATQEPGETVTIVSTVKNDGNAASGETKLAYYSNGNQIGETAVPSLQAGESRQISFSWESETEETFTISALVDPENTVEESNEDNNYSPDTSVTFKKIWFPDLIVDTLSPTPTNPEPGEDVTIQIAAKNQGNAASGATKVSLYIGGNKIRDWNIPELDPGNSNQISYRWTPEAEGTVEMRATVDEENLVYESNEGNNAKAVSVTVKQKLPDLIVDTLSPTPTDPEPGDKVTIQIAAKNQGDAASGATKVSLYIGGNKIRDWNIPELAPGNSDQISYTWTAETEGTVEIRAAVDEENLVYESNEGNNAKAVSVTVKQKLPDLIIESLVSNPENPQPWETTTVQAVVKNVGTKTSGTTNLAYRIGDMSKTEIVQAIDPGKTYKVSFTWTPTVEETINVWAKVDEMELVSESDEENNEKTISVIVGTEKLPDLIIEGLSPESNEPEAGKPLNFNLAVKNQGTAPAEASVARYYINGSYRGDVTIPALSDGASISTSFSLVPDKEGVIEVKVIADSGNTLRELDEDNNEIATLLTVKPEVVEYPDLIVSSLSLNPASPKPGENITFTVTVKNRGPGASQSSELDYYFNGIYKGKISIPAIAAGENANGVFFWVPESESKTNVRLIADARSTITENDEENNELTKTITVSKVAVSSGGGSSSSSGMGRGGSREPASNVEIKELVTRNIMSGYHVRYDFPQKVTCVTYLEFDPLRTYKKTVTIVEMLKKKSTLVPKLPPGRIYKQLNIWIGDSGAGNPQALKNAHIEFRVDKEWVKNNNVNESLISLLRYDGKWNPLETTKVREDGQYIYFDAKTPGYSCFAITEYTGEEETNDGKIQDALSSLSASGRSVILNGSAEKEGEKKPFGQAKILMAISLPLFMILVEYFVLKKKI